VRVGATVTVRGDRPKPTAAERPKPRANHALGALIAELVREAPSGAGAWKVLSIGADLDRDGDGRELVVPVLMSPERLAANNAAMEVDYRIARGWEWLAKCGDGPYPRSWVERLKELHAESQDRLFELDAVRIAEAVTAGKSGLDAWGCLLSRAAQEADGYAAGLDKEAFADATHPYLARMGEAIDALDVDLARRAAKEYVWAAVEAKYAAGGIDEDA